MYHRLNQLLKHPQIMICILVASVCISIFFTFLYFNTSQSNEQAAQANPTTLTENIATSDTISEKESTQVTDIIVDVKGAVKKVQPYTMKSNQRVKDVLEKAGILPQADLSQINLAEKLIDQKLIYVPKKGEATSAQRITTSLSNQDSQKQPINLNLAQESDLVEVPGIGPSKAQSIIAYRDEKGGFKSVEDLKEIKGIGEKTFEKLKDYFTV
ncbi:competence protein ComEA [Staphylococcus chromogenes]|uniref:helix-hairpin-helix domain-containing protein n=1 Tax=Staphylococcus chromogenes TaxID=46126 RepID=UPI00118A2991|nr:helix-hairpin-helix domain-containing protein [Staphylococcus chromogenes]QDW91519.1 competence protein ComEA [Staphylococcus chromogenes]QIN26582.1 competence protein ComEA [Staphylococcus chromogenes]